MRVSFDVRWLRLWVPIQQTVVALTLSLTDCDMSVVSSAPESILERLPPPLSAAICSTLLGRPSILWCSTLGKHSNSHFVASIVRQYGHGLRRFLSFHLRNVDDVPDLAQEVYLRLLRVKRQEIIRNPEAYLITVARRVLRQHLLCRAAGTAFVDGTEALPDLMAPPGEDPCTMAENSERVERFQRILRRLPPRLGAALVMHRIGYTVQEVADELGVARETAKKYLARAAEHCRRSGYDGRYEK